MTTPEGELPKPPAPAYDDSPEAWGILPEDADMFGEVTSSVVPTTPEADAPTLPARPDAAPTVGMPAATAETKRRGFMPRTRVGKVAAGLLLAGVAASGYGMLESSRGQSDIDAAATYVMQHPNGLSPQDRVAHGIPSADAYDQISTGKTFEEIGEGALAVDAALLATWGVGNRLRALGARRKRKAEEKAANPEQGRKERRQARRLAAARKLVEANQPAASDESSED